MTERTSGYASPTVMGGLFGGIAGGLAVAMPGNPVRGAYYARAMDESFLRYAAMDTVKKPPTFVLVGAYPDSYGYRNSVRLVLF